MPRLSSRARARRRAHAPPRARLRTSWPATSSRVDVDGDDRRDLLEARGVAQHTGADRHRVLQLLARIAPDARRGRARRGRPGARQPRMTPVGLGRVLAPRRSPRRSAARTRGRRAASWTRAGSRRARPSRRPRRTTTARAGSTRRRGRRRSRPTGSARPAPPAGSRRAGRGPRLCAERQIVGNFSGKSAMPVASSHRWSSAAGDEPAGDGPRDDVARREVARAGARRP